MTVTDRLTDLERDLAREWLLTDGVGGFASYTAAHCATRRYHGLLVAVPPGHVKRHLFLGRFDETARADGGGRVVHMACGRYVDGSYAPDGYDALADFTVTPHPTSRYRARDLEIVREVVMVRGEPTVLSRYTAHGGDVDLELRPLLAFREADSLTFENDVAVTDVETIGRGVAFTLYDGLPTLRITVGGAPFTYEHDPVWYKGIEYAEELARGYSGEEEQVSPGRLHVTLCDGESVVVAATITDAVPDPVGRWDRIVDERAADRAAAATRWPDDPSLARVDASADDFLYRDANGRLGICAGYPWFLEWGRDTFLSLPGLTLARGRPAQCQEVIDGALPFLRDGLLPNIYGADQDDSHYGSVDAALWFARAVDLFVASGHAQDERVRKVYVPALREIASAYEDGTDLGIRADDGMLIAAGGPELNATWMDARTPDGPVTPREGCAVEINALWFSLLDMLAEFDTDKRRRGRWAKTRDRVGETFLERLWLEDERYLADRWFEGVADRKVRPNMVLAAALARSPLTVAMRRDVVGHAHDRLLTPCGLRTLNRSDPDYRGTYGGDPATRDGAYHQGTVWPWLLGFYTEAALRAFGRSEVGELRDAWRSVLAEVDRAGLEHISEVFDGDPPHRPGGTIAQAWNTAECLRSARLLADPAVLG